MMFHGLAGSRLGRFAASSAETLRFVGRSGATALAIGVAILLLLVAGSVMLAIRNGEALSVALRTQDARTSVATVRQNLLRAESGQRGYLLTGKQSYLEPYRDALGSFGRAMSRLEDQLADDPQTGPLLAEIRAVAADKFSELDETLRLDASGNRIGAMALVQSDRGQRAMDRLQSLNSRLADQQQERLIGELDAVRRGTRILEAANIAGMICILGLALIVGSSLRRAVAALDGARLALAASNETLEAKVAQRTIDLTEANDEIQRFAYIVSHDLRAPLVNIMGFTGELEVAAGVIGRHLTAIEARAPDVVAPELREAVYEEMDEAIGFIRTSTNKMDRLIKAILHLAREGRRVLAPERVAMRATLAGIAETLAHQLAEAGAQVTVAVMPDLMADRIAIEQIFSNLIENAVKYLKPGRPGRIVLRGRIDKRPVLRQAGLAGQAREAVFEVADNGRGIAGRDLERVFELFRRSGDQSVPGEGIGLAHVRALVRRMGGKIDCESTPDVGSTFRVRLPLQPPRTGATL